jgi:hypothetical protein
MSTPEFDITPHTQMWQKFLRWAAIASVVVAVIVFGVVTLITA